LHGVWIKQVFQSRMKKDVGFGGAAYSALRQQLGHNER
jgi:hypothetical protein